MEKKAQRKLVIGIIIGLIIISIIGLYFLYFNNKLSMDYEDNKINSFDSSVFSAEVTFADVSIDYKNDNMTIEFKDGLEVIGEATLKSHETYDEVLRVSPSEDAMVIWYEFSNFKDIQEDALQNVEFIDMREEIANESLLEKGGFIKAEDLGIPNPNYLLPVEKNYSFVYLDEKGDWINFNSFDIPKENIIIGIKTDISHGEHLDIVFNVFDNKLERHALVLGTDSGFVTTTPVTSPTPDQGMDTTASAQKDTAPASAIRVTEIGWYSSASEEANYEVAIYTHDSGNDRPLDIIDVSRTNAKGTGAGWKSVTGLDIPITAATTYWIGVQLDDTATTTLIPLDVVSGRIHIFSSQVTLPDPWSGGTGTDNRLLGIYAVWSNLTAASVVNTTLNSPVDYFNSTSNSVEFNCSANTTSPGGEVLTNNSLWLNITGTWILNETDFINGTSNISIFTKNIPDGINYEWTCQAYDNSSISGWGINRTFSVDVTFPQINITFPTAINYTTNVSALNYTFVEASPSACWYSEDSGTTNSTPVTCGTNFTGLTSDEGANTWTVYINDTAGNENSTSVTFYKNTAFPQVNITFPTAINYTTNVSTLNYTFIEISPSACWYSEDSGTTNSSNVICGTNFTGLTSDEGSNTWTVYINDTAGNENSTSVTFFKDTIFPQITINEPISIINYGYEGKAETLNWSVIEINPLSIWFNHNGTNITLNGLVNSTTFILGTSPFNLTLWANDTSGNENSSYINWTYNIFNNSETYNITTYETATETFSINITANASLTAARLVYDGTSYAATQSGNVWSRAIDIPLGTANNNFYWNFTYAGSYITTTPNTQTVNLTRFVQCNGTYTTTYINYTFADETNATKLAANFPLATFVYWLGDGTINKTLSYTNTTDYNHFAFCVDASHLSLNVAQNIQYNRNLYQQRIVAYLDTLTNTTTSRELLLLRTTSGQFVTYQVINTAEQTIENVFVNVTYSGTLIGSGFTDAAGAITFFLNPDFTHHLVFRLDGYDTYILDHFPTQTSYTVNLGGETGETINDYTQGISYATHPQNTTLTNNTAYDFKFILASSYWTVTEFGFVLRNTTGSVVGSNSASSNGGTVTLNYDVGNNSQIFMDYYWVIAGNYTNITRMWYVLSASGSDWSLMTFFEDFNNYTSQEIFGLDNFGRNIIVFLVIFIFTGIMSYKYGLISPAAIASITFGLVFLFDVGFGMISLPVVGAVSHFPTIFMGLVLLGVLFREVYQ